MKINLGINEHPKVNFRKTINCSIGTSASHVIKDGTQTIQHQYVAGKLDRPTDL